MPGKNTPHPDNLHFAELLRAALQAAQLHDPALVGQLVANAQEAPEREDFPYHPAVVRAWLGAASLPSEPAFDALTTMLNDVISPSFEDAYEAAVLTCPHQPASEVGRVLQHRLKQHGYSYKKLSKTLYDQGICGFAGKPIVVPTIHYWCRGVNAIPSTIVAVLDTLLPPEADYPLSLQELQRVGKPTPETYLAKAAATPDIHRALRYMRRALNFSGPQMADAINAYLPQGTKTPNVKLLNWETIEDKPNSTLPSARSFPGTDLVTVYTTILTDAGFGAWATQHEAHLRQILENGIRYRHQTQVHAVTYTPSQRQQPLPIQR